VGATLSMYPAPNSMAHGQLHAWDAGTGKIVQSHAEKFSVWSGAMNTAGGLSCYGTLEGYLSARQEGHQQGTFQVQDASGSSATCSRMNTRQAVHRRVLGIGGWAGIGMAAGLEKDTDGLGAVAATAN